MPDWRTLLGQGEFGLPTHFRAFSHGLSLIRMTSSWVARPAAMIVSRCEALTPVRQPGESARPVLPRRTWPRIGHMPERIFAWSRLHVSRTPWRRLCIARNRRRKFDEQIGNYL
jgi:hypothetical protein